MQEKTWQDSLYDKTFSEEYEGLKRRFAHDKNLSIEDLNGMLKTLYDMDGQDWLGRGEVQSITLSAVIAAYESFISSGDF
jgi:hypothetical protein